jgi:hypothetical protein
MFDLPRCRVSSRPVAIYRCQAPSPDCGCPECERERFLKAHPDKRRPAPKPPEPTRIDSHGVKWYALSVADNQMR